LICVHGLFEFQGALSRVAIITGMTKMMDGDDGRRLATAEIMLIMELCFKMFCVCVPHDDAKQYGDPLSYFK
jgi:hypothetical protein